MGSTYSISVLTIATGMSADSDGGLFNEKSQTQESSAGLATIMSRLSNGQKSRIIISMDVHSQPYDLTLDPLHYRA